MQNYPLEEVDEKVFDHQFNINVKAPFFIIQKAVKFMTKGSKIINLSSSVVGSMYANYAVYAATKGAIDQLTRHLAKELGPKGISINAIAPGPTSTDMYNKGRSKEEILETSKGIAFKRIGKPSDIANVVVLLASDKSSWITGQTIKANGGLV